MMSHRRAIMALALLRAGRQAGPSVGSVRPGGQRMPGRPSPHVRPGMP